MKITTTLGMLAFTLKAPGQPALRPFPQHVKYFKGTIKPANIPQSQLDHQTAAFYDEWKNRYIKQLRGKQAYVWFDEKRGHKRCVSEGQGYGMVITALMAGHDEHAKETYDALYRYYKAHPSGRGKYLMAWAQKNDGGDADKTSASDGDMDIAYSLLLADKQWGSKGAVNYINEAKLLLADIMHFEINPLTHTVLLSDGVEHDSKDYFDMRSSDFMPANFTAFARATGNARWLKVNDSGFGMMKVMQEKYSPSAGLLPDFIVGLNKNPRPAPPNFLESKYDGCYNYNACRDPWRIGLAYLLYGDKRAKSICDKMNYWIRLTANNDTFNLSAGYTLAGNDLKQRYFEALSFSAPFAISAMVDAKNQAWLNKLWGYINAFKLKDFDYYDNTIKLLDMIIISGNYWTVN